MQSLLFFGKARAGHHVAFITLFVFGDVLLQASCGKQVSNVSGANIASQLQPKLDGDFKDTLRSSSTGHTNNLSALPDILKNGELSNLFCENCTDVQRQRVEQILYLLYNFNNAGQASNNHALMYPKNYVLYKQKSGFKATASPIPVYRKNLPEMIPTPETREFIPQLAGISSTTTSPGYSSMAIPIVPYFYAASQTSPLPASGLSTTLSSALEPAQSVEMPTPPLPPTTSGPVYLYYLGHSSSSPASSLSSSGSLEPPTTPVSTTQYTR